MLTPNRRNGREIRCALSEPRHRSTTGARSKLAILSLLREPLLWESLLWVLLLGE